MAATRIHRFWRGPAHPMTAFTRAAIESSCPGAVLTDWDDESLAAEDLLLAENLADDDPRHVANVARYALLHRYGGLWLDHDVVVLADLTTARSPWTAGWGRAREGCAMWFPNSGHPLALQLFGAAVSAPAGPSVARSGADVLTKYGARHPDVHVNESVVPLDATGARRGSRTPTAVHLWATSTGAKR